MFGFNDNNIEKVKMPFPATEIVSGVKVANVEFGSTENSQFVDLSLEKTTEDVLMSHRERMFPPSKEYVTKFNGETLEQAYNRNLIEYNTKLLQVATSCGVTKAQLREACDGTQTFKDFAEAYTSCVMQNLKPVTLVNVKMVPKSDGYPTFPYNGLFIESHTEGEETGLFYKKAEVTRIKNYLGETDNAESTVEEVTPDYT